MWQNFFRNDFDRQAAEWFLHHRSYLGIKIFNIITIFGNWAILLLVLFAILIFLYFKNHKKFIIPFFLVVIGADAITFFGKIFFHRQRPLSGALNETDFSFPSGHATIAVAFYGFLAYMLARSSNKKYHGIIIFLAVLMILLIGYSRLYLGVHFVTDVLAGYLVGLTSLLVGVYKTERFIKN
jgi:membrane-associated phospholipid phosphatase